VEQTIGDRLAATRTAKGLVAKWVAEQAGVSPQHLSEIENNRVADPGISVLVRICDVLGAWLDYIVRGETVDA
jgi:transcriptional regulator with XRE-family HTH domain